jgi:hypothetical protein
MVDRVNGEERAVPRPHQAGQNLPSFKPVYLYSLVHGAFIATRYIKVLSFEGVRTLYSILEEVPVLFVVVFGASQATGKKRHGPILKHFIPKKLRIQHKLMNQSASTFSLHCKHDFFICGLLYRMLNISHYM